MKFWWPKSPAQKITAWVVLSVLLQASILWGLDSMLATDDVVVGEHGDIKTFTLDRDLEKAKQVSLSYQGRYVAYLENNRLHVVNVEKDSLVYSESPEQGGTIQYIQWLPDRDRLLMVTAIPSYEVKEPPAKKEEGAEDPPKGAADKTADPKDKDKDKDKNKNGGKEAAYKLDGREVPIAFMTAANKNAAPASAQPKRLPYVKIQIHLINHDGGNKLLAKELVNLHPATEVTEVAMSTFSNVLYLKMENKEQRRDYIHLVDINHRSLPITWAAEVGRLVISQEKGVLYAQINDGRTRFVNVKRDKMTPLDLKSNDNFVLLGIDQKDNLYFGKVPKNSAAKPKVEGVYRFSQGAMEKLLDLPGAAGDDIQITPMGHILVGNPAVPGIVDVYPPTIIDSKQAKVEGDFWKRVPAGPQLIGWMRPAKGGTELALYRI